MFELQLAKFARHQHFALLVYYFREFSLFASAGGALRDMGEARTHKNMRILAINHRLNQKISEKYFFRNLIAS
jgi:hypothetical protein